MGANNPLTGGIESDHEMNLNTAKRLEADSQYQAAQRRKLAMKMMGEQVQAYAANNIEVSGSAAQVIQEDQVEAEIEAMNMIYSGKFQAAEMRERSRQQRNSAYLGLAKEAGMAYLSGGGSLAFSASKRVGTNSPSSSGGQGYYSENSSSGTIPRSKGLA